MLPNRFEELKVRAARERDAAIEAANLQYAARMDAIEWMCGADGLRKPTNDPPVGSSNLERPLLHSRVQESSSVGVASTVRAFVSDTAGEFNTQELLDHLASKNLRGEAVKAAAMAAVKRLMASHELFRVRKGSVKSPAVFKGVLNKV